jgi:hypothetical protein
VFLGNRRSLHKNAILKKKKKRRTKECNFNKTRKTSEPLLQHLFAKDTHNAQNIFLGAKQTFVALI